MRRGDNGVMLTKFLGIGEVREIMLQFNSDGYEDPIAWYPMATPINSILLYILSHTETKICFIQGCMLNADRVAVE